MVSVHQLLCIFTPILGMLLQFHEHMFYSWGGSRVQTLKIVFCRLFLEKFCITKRTKTLSLDLADIFVKGNPYRMDRTCRPTTMSQRSSSQLPPFLVCVLLGR